MWEGAASHQLLLCLPGLCLPVSVVISPVIPSVVPEVSTPVPIIVSVPVIPAVAAVLIGPASVSLPLLIKAAIPFTIPAETPGSDGQLKHLFVFHMMTGPQAQSCALHSISDAWYTQTMPSSC